MSSFKYTAGLNNVGSYQVSGKPYMSTFDCVASGSTPTKVEFPYVTKEITITNAIDNAHSHIRIAMSAKGTEDDSEHFLVGPTKDGNGSVTLNIKCTELHVMSDDNQTGKVSVFASLTGLDVERVTNISPSGSNWSGSAGVG